MVILYSLDGATGITDPDTGTIYTPNEDGQFDVPATLGDTLTAVHIAGRRVWETIPERYVRLEAEETARRKDPATLLAEVEKLTTAPQLTAEQLRAAEEERKRIKAEQEAEAAADAEKARAAREAEVKYQEELAARETAAAEALAKAREAHEQTPEAAPARRGRKPAAAK